jgi:histidinol-phosphate aminotransferase
MQSLIRKNIQKLVPYSSARSEFKGSASVFLDANENPYDTGYNRYPDPLQWVLKEKISKIKGVDKKQIFLGNGSDEAIDLLIRIFCEPGEDHIITLPPTYGMYKVSADISNVAIKEIPLTQDFQPDVDTILQQANANSKLLFLCSPNNPTGNSFSLQAIRQLADQFSGVLVIDEAYIDFSSQESCTSLLASYPRLVVLQTFSKAWGLAGIRLGMAFANEPIVELFNKVKPPYNINLLTQQTALEALNQQDKMQLWVQELLSQRKELGESLEQLAWVDKIYPSDANFLLVKMEKPRAVYDFLVNQGIIVRDRSRVLLCEGCLRITIGTPQENQQLLTSLSAYK